jgi:hypothetical protein
MVMDRHLVSPGNIDPLWRPGSAQRVRVCDMWRRAVTCLWLVRSSARSIASSRSWTVRTRDGFAGPTNSTSTRSRREEAGRGARPPPANVLSHGFVSVFSEREFSVRQARSAMRHDGGAHGTTRSPQTAADPH